jgi:hypothetical protein
MHKKKNGVPINALVASSTALAAENDGTQAVATAETTMSPDAYPHAMQRVQGSESGLAVAPPMRADKMPSGSTHTAGCSSGDEIAPEAKIALEGASDADGVAGGDLPIRNSGHCLWCDGPLPTGPRRGSARRFCRTEHRTAFHSAARRFVNQAITAGRLTVADLHAPGKACALATRVSRRGGLSASRCPVDQPSYESYGQTR